MELIREEHEGRQGKLGVKFIKKKVTAQPGRTGTRISRKELIIESSFKERIIREIRGICGIRVQVYWVERWDFDFPLSAGRFIVWRGVAE